MIILSLVYTHLYQSAHSQTVLMWLAECTKRNVGPLCLRLISVCCVLIW